MLLSNTWASSTAVSGPASAAAPGAGEAGMEAGLLAGSVDDTCNKQPHDLNDSLCTCAPTKQVPLAPFGRAKHPIYPQTTSPQRPLPAATPAVAVWSLAQAWTSPAAQPLAAACGRRPSRGGRASGAARGPCPATACCRLPRHPASPDGAWSQQLNEINFKLKTSTT